MSSIARKVRKEKEQHPERFCSVKGCLWRTATRSGYWPCAKHSEAEHNGARQSAVPGGERGEQGAPASRSLPDSRLHEPYCKCRRCDVEI